MKPKTTKPENWREDEIRLLRELIPQLGIAGLYKSGWLQGRTRLAIKNKAHDLGIEARQFRKGGGHKEECMEPGWPLPAMYEYEKPPCRLMVEWRGPVSPNLGLRV